MLRTSLSIELRDYSIDELIPVAKGEVEISLSDKCKAAVKSCRAYLDKRLDESDEAIYGINTGFGSLCDTVIEKNELQELQENLVKSHAAGSGPELQPEIVRLMMFLKILGLSKGYSGVRVELLERMIEMYNQDVLPVIYEQGSLGASGDLAPLAHLSLPLIGAGEVNRKGQKLPGGALEQQFGWKALVLESKEGIALLNGTQFMSAHGVFILQQFSHLFDKATQIAAISIEAFQARLNPFHPSLHKIRKQPGQEYISSKIRSFLKDSSMQKEEVPYVQDPYTFRCIPQVLGASHDVFEQAKSVVENELNSVTDNPTIFEDEDLILSGGNFHGQAIAMALDHLKLAIHELGSISERRVYKLISGQRGLPAFLVAKPGINSGFMIPQYTAASLVSRSKALCFPNSADTIDSSNGQEDHVSMGANSALSCNQVLDLVYQVIAIEYLSSCQAIEFRRPSKSSLVIEEMISDLRAEVPFLQKDDVMQGHMLKALSKIKA